MSKFKENNFFKKILSLLKSKEQEIKQPRLDKNEDIKNDVIEQSNENESIKDVLVEQLNENESIKSTLVEKSKVKPKNWKKDYNPLRSVVLWGYDEEDNPSFLILYGEHKFKSTENQGEGVSSILDDNVKYTSYALFKGKEGHLPAFQSVKVIENGSLSKMYYKTGLKHNWSWSADENYRVKEFKNLGPEEQISLPYFTSNTYEEYTHILKENNINFPDFKLAKHPNEILKLSEERYEYYEVIYELLSNENLYMRKKALNELLEMNPTKDIYKLLLNIGSTELVSGLFLEFAKRNNPALLEEAKTIFEAEINWAEESYIKGLKRCAYIYIIGMDNELKAEKIKSIYKALPDMDLHLININGNDIPEGKILEGSTYRKYAAQGLLKEHYGRYDYNLRKWVEYRSPQRYKISTYSDGVILNTLELKNTIQEAEAYGLADVIGKIAYYLDAPRLSYYCRGNDKTKELKYYKRYVRRIIDSYGKNDPEKFMQAMKALLSSYTQYDYVCKFRGNFQFNEFLKYYLYYDFSERPPVGWENWQARSVWMENDQLMKLTGRYEFMKEIWDNHLQDVLEIASKAKINSVLKACYYILKDSKNTDAFVDKMPYKELINLTEGSYEPLADVFKDILYNKLNAMTVFEPQIMIDLMSSSKEEIHELAKEFINRTNGAFKANELVNLMLIDNIDVWTDLLKESILSLDSIEYCNFVKAIINNSEKFTTANIEFSKKIKDILSLSTSKVQDISEDERASLVSGMITELFNVNKMTDWMQQFIEYVIFSVSYEDLDNLLKKITIEQANKVISQKSRQVICVLEAIQNRKLPSDSEIISILETGSSKMINILFGSIMENDEELSTRFSTLLIMFESDITILNKRAEEVFDNMLEEKRRKLHGIIIDSPVNKVYSFGLRKLDEIYKELIPKEFILQMLEHTSSEVKAYISNKTNEILNNLGNGDKELFMYYVKTLLFLPNKVSKSKDNVYEAIPKFILKHKDKVNEFEDMLLDIGGSNIIIDSERALTTLAQIKKEVC